MDNKVFVTIDAQCNHENRQNYSSIYLNPAITNRKTDWRLQLKAERGCDGSYCSSEKTFSIQTGVNESAQRLVKWAWLVVTSNGRNAFWRALLKERQKRREEEEEEEEEEGGGGEGEGREEGGEGGGERGEGEEGGGGEGGEGGRGGGGGREGGGGGEEEEEECASCHPFPCTRVNIFLKRAFLLKISCL